MIRFYRVTDSEGYEWTSDWLMAVRPGEDKYKKACDAYANGRDYGWKFQYVMSKPIDAD